MGSKMKMIIDEDRQPAIKLQWESSDEIVDTVFKLFIERFAHKSFLCEVKVTIDGSRQKEFIIRPIPPEDLLSKMDIQRMVIDPDSEWITSIPYDEKDTPEYYGHPSPPDFPENPKNPVEAIAILENILLGKSKYRLVTPVDIINSGSKKIHEKIMSENIILYFDIESESWTLKEVLKSKLSDFKDVLTEAREKGVATISEEQRQAEIKDILDRTEDMRQTTGVPHEIEIVKASYDVYSVVEFLVDVATLKKGEARRQVTMGAVSINGGKIDFSMMEGKIHQFPLIDGKLDVKIGWRKFAVTIVE